MATYNPETERWRTDLCAKILTDPLLAIESISAYVDRLTDEEVYEALYPTSAYCSTCDAECSGHH